MCFTEYSDCLKKNDTSFKVDINRQSKLNPTMKTDYIHQ